MVTELVDEDVRRLLAIGSDGAVQPEDSPATISPRIRDDLDEFVWRKRSDVAERAILKRKNVTLGTESVVAGA